MITTQIECFRRAPPKKKKKKQKQKKKTNIKTGSENVVKILKRVIRCQKSPYLWYARINVKRSFWLPQTTLNAKSGSSVIFNISLNFAFPDGVCCILFLCMKSYHQSELIFNPDRI